jgi:hypothetical protein
MMCYNLSRRNVMRERMMSYVLAFFVLSCPTVLMAQLELEYSTFLGGTSTDVLTSVDLDSSGNIYVLGFSYSYDWLPVPAYMYEWFEDGEYNEKYRERDLIIAKFDPSGKRVWATFLGGLGNDFGYDIDVDNGEAYVTGWAHNAGGFPTTSGAYCDAEDCNGLFVTKLSDEGAISYSTFIGESYELWPTMGYGIAVHNGCAYVCGEIYESQIDDFPLVNPSQSFFGGGGLDAFVLRLNVYGNALTWCTFLGGNDEDWASDIAVDGDGNAYVTGGTASANFPVTQACYSPNLTGEGTLDAFVTKFSADEGVRVYSTFLPSGKSADYYGVDEEGTGIDVDSQGYAYALCGYGYFADTGYWDLTNIFVAKVERDGSSLSYVKGIAGSYQDVSTRIAVDAEGCAYLTGYTRSADFDSYGSCEQCSGGAYSYGQNYMMEKPDAFVAKVSSHGRCLEYCALIGTDGEDKGYDIAPDAYGNTYVVGMTESGDFPIISAYQGSYGGGFADGFLSKLWFVPSAGFCVRNSTLRVGDRFSLEVNITKDVQGPLDVVTLLGARPEWGPNVLYSVTLNGQLRQGVYTMVRGIPALQAPINQVLLPEFELQEQHVGAYTFYCITTNPGLVPPTGFQMELEQFESKLEEWESLYLKTMNIHRWVVDHPPAPEGLHIPTAKEWDELFKEGE